MSHSPDVVLDKLRAYAKDVGIGGPVPPPSPAVVAHFLALFDHLNRQLDALRELKTPPRTALGDDEDEIPRPEPTETVCQEADRLVSLDRQAQYGHPRDDMNRTATMWEALLGLPPGGIDPEQVAMCMIAVKLSRLCHGYKRDTIVDIAGYAKCIDLIRQAAPATNLVG